MMTQRCLLHAARLLAYFLRTPVISFGINRNRRRRGTFGAPGSFSDNETGVRRSHRRWREREWAKFLLRNGSRCRELWMIINRGWTFRNQRKYTALTLRYLFFQLDFRTLRVMRKRISRQTVSATVGGILLPVPREECMKNFPKDCIHKSYREFSSAVRKCIIS